MFELDEKQNEQAFEAFKKEEAGPEVLSDMYKSGMLELQYGKFDMPNETYHSGPGLSRSAIMELKRSPYHYYWKYVLGNKDKPTDAMILGSAVHTMILEPHLWPTLYQEADLDLRKTADKAEAARIEKSGLTLIRMKDFEKIEAMGRSFHNNEYAPMFMNGAEMEQSLFWKDERTNIFCKSRPDIMKVFVEDGKQKIWITDLKTDIDPSFKAFQGTIYNRGYHIQCAMQREAIKVIYGHDNVEFFFAVIEKSEPYCVAIYEMDERAIDFGLDEFRNSLDIYVQCMDSKEWPGYGIKKVGLPGWAEYEIERSES